MNFKADDYLAHHGVKGMKWRKHKYKLVKGADGKLHYIYDDANNTSKKASIARQKNGNSAARRMQQETQAKRVLADVIKKGGDPNHSYTVGYTDKNGQHISGKYMPNEKSLSAVSFDKNGKVSPVYTKEAKELMADNKRKYDEHNRQERIRINKSTEQQVDDRKRVRQASAESKARAAESTARHKTAATAQARAEEEGARAAQEYHIKKTQEAAAEKRKLADDWRKVDRSIESLAYSNNPYSTTVQEQYRKGDSERKDRFRRVKEFQYEPSKETKKRLKKNKRKKNVSDVKRFINGFVNRK